MICVGQRGAVGSIYQIGRKGRRGSGGEYSRGINVWWRKNIMSMSSSKDEVVQFPGIFDCYTEAWLRLAGWWYLTGAKTFTLYPKGSFSSFPSLLKGRWGKTGKKAIVTLFLRWSFALCWGLIKKFLSIIFSLRFREELSEDQMSCIYSPYRMCVSHPAWSSAVLCIPFFCHRLIKLMCGQHLPYMAERFHVRFKMIRWEVNG